MLLGPFRHDNGSDLARGSHPRLPKRGGCCYGGLFALRQTDLWWRFLLQVAHVSALWAVVGG